jgi:hypothetical protein
VLAARGIVSTKQYLGFVLSRRRTLEKESDGEAGESEAPSTPADAGEPVLST